MHATVQARLERTLGRAGRVRTAPSTRGIDAFLWEKRWFIIALAVGALLMSLPAPEGLGQRGLIVLSMSVSVRRATPWLYQSNSPANSRITKVNPTSVYNTNNVSAMAYPRFPAGSRGG